MPIEPYIWWATAGLILIILDLIVGSFFVLFLGAGALVTAIAALLGVRNPVLHWTIFAVSSLLFATLLRKPLLAKFGPKSQPSYEEHKGQIVEITSEENSNGYAKAMYRGSLWMVKSKSGADLQIGQKLPIVDMDGIIIILD